ncbi:MAG: hypothetical protein ACYTGQ_06520 [Planctomycetota bacterium]|jgi:hypothetical protein
MIAWIPEITFDLSELNLWAAWVGILLGMISGAIQGLVFHRDDALGPYQGWRRRLTRLGHISFFGLAGVNLAFTLTVDRYNIASMSEAPTLLAVASFTLIAGAILMPLSCYLAAWRKPLRHLFPVPVICLLVGGACLLSWGVLS